MNKTFLKGLFFGILIVATVSSYAATSVWTNEGETVETHEMHKEQKIVFYGASEFNRNNNYSVTVPYGWHAIAITDVGAGGACLVVMEKN